MFTLSYIIRNTNPSAFIDDKKGELSSFLRDSKVVLFGSLRQAINCTLQHVYDLLVASGTQFKKCTVTIDGVTLRTEHMSILRDNDEDVFQSKMPIIAIWLEAQLAKKTEEGVQEFITTYDVNNVYKGVEVDKGDVGLLARKTIENSKKFLKVKMARAAMATLTPEARANLNNAVKAASLYNQQVKLLSK